MVRYPTGIAGLDLELGGGMHPGALVVVETDTTGQGDSLLRHLAAQQPTLYLSTTRTEENAKEWLHDHQLLIDMTHIHVEYTGIDNKLEFIDDYLGQLEKPLNIIIDPVNTVASRKEEEYLETLYHLKSYLQENRRIGYLHVQSTHRDGSYEVDSNLAAVYRTADMVWKLASHITSERNTTRLVVSKRRAHATPERPLELTIGKEITVDTGRKITL